MLNNICKKVLLLVFVIRVFYHNESAVSSLYTDYDKNSLEFVCTNQSASSLKFHLPFTDLFLSTEYNVVLKQCAQTNKLFVLHGPELYELLLEDDKQQIIYLGSLQHTEFVEWEILFWGNYYTLVVALEDHLAIYQISAEFVKNQANKKANTVASWVPIQQISLQGQFHKMFLTSPATDKLLLIFKVKFTTSNDKLFTFAWKNTYFDAVEELVIKSVQAMEMIGERSKFIVTGRILAQNRQSIITIYERNLPSMRLKVLQTLTMNSETLFGGTFQGTAYLVGCRKKDNEMCSSLEEEDGKFYIPQSKPYKELNLKLMQTADNFIVGVRDKNLQVFPNIQFNCHHKIILEENNVTQLLVHENIKGIHYIVLHYKYGFKTLLRFLKVEVLESANLKSQQETVHKTLDSKNILENSIAELRGILLRRRSAMDVFKRVKSFVNNKLGHVKTKKPVHIDKGYIGSVKVEDKSLVTPTELLKRIEKMRELISKQKQRHQRSIETDKVKNTTQPIMETLKARKLRIKNLIYEHNVLEGYHLENSTGTLPILSISKNVSTKYLDTEELFTRQNYKPLESNNNKNSRNVLKVHQLVVKTINNVSWTDFYESVYLKNRDTQIKGRLIFQSDFKVNQLETPLLNGQLVAQLFNLITPQVVHSNILISAFFANELYAKELNGLDFAKDVVFSGEDVVINSPVVMYEMSVAENIIFPSTLQLNSSIGPVPMQQTYTGEVVINGSLHVNNVFLENIKTQIWLDDVPLVPALLNKTYLLNHTAQVIDFPVTFENSKVTVPTLHTQYLNDYPTTQHLLTTTKISPSDEPMNLIFMNAVISGNLTHTHKEETDLWQLHKSVVRHGEIANITGFKTFTSSLTVDHLLSLELNNMSVSNLVLKQQLANGYEFLGTKYFQNVSVASTAHVSQHLNATYLNDMELAELLNYNYYYESLTVPHHLNISSLVFQKINGIPFDEIFNKFEVRNDELVLQTSLIIDGNVDFNDEITITNINNINWNDYQRNLVMSNESVVLPDEVIFLGSLNITKSLTTPVINEVNVSTLYSNILTNSSAQQISGVYTFENVEMPNLDVERINNIPITDFINTESEIVIIDGDLVVPSITVIGNSSINFADDINLINLEQDLHNILKHNWNNIVVHGNVTWPDDSIQQKDNIDKLEYLWKNAVRRGAQQTITGNVRLISPTINKMFSKSSLSENLDKIFADSLLKNSSSTQYVKAAKWFKVPQYMRNVRVQKILEVENLNNVNIASFNETLYRVSSKKPITAALRFLHAPVIQNLNVEGLVNGRNTSAIYHLDLPEMPPVKLSNLVIEKDLEIQHINNVNLNEFLKNRVTKDGSSLKSLYNVVFENLVINQKASLNTINDIPLDQLVFKDSKVMQTINGPKQILGRLIFEGPVHVMQVNNRDLMESFLLTIHTNKDFHFDTLTVEEATFNAGLHISDPSESSEERVSSAPENTLNPCDFSEREQKYEELSHAVDNFKNIMRNRTPQLRYIDFDLNMQVFWQEPKENISIINKYQLTCNSLCERNFLMVQRAANGNRLYLKNATTHHLTANHSDLFVKVDNNCAKFMSKIKLDLNEFNQVWEYPEVVESVDILAPTKNTAFLMLNVINFYVNQAYIRILKIDKNMKTITDWQNISISTMGEGMLHVKNDKLITLSLQAKGDASINVYGFNQQNELFDLRQIIEGDFNLIEIISSGERNQQIIASCWQCVDVKIYVYNEMQDSYNILQIIQLELPIEQLIVFKVEENTWYLLLLSKQPKHFEYQLYKYAFSQGWISVSKGKFENLHAALPLISKQQTLDEENNLLLLCDEIGTCRIVKAFII